MLLMFKVKNYTSFKNESILDMQATAYVQHPEEHNHKKKKPCTVSVLCTDAGTGRNIICRLPDLPFFLNASQ